MGNLKKNNLFINNNNIYVDSGVFNVDFVLLRKLFLVGIALLRKFR